MLRGLRSILLVSFVAMACQKKELSQVKGDKNSTANLPADPADCVFTPGDPFEPKVRLPKGTYKGHCIDTTVQRPVVRLNADQIKAAGFTADDSVFVANFYHDETFWLAKIPIDKATKSIFHIQHFTESNPTAHAQIRLLFPAEHPVELVRQLPGVTPSTSKVTDVLISVEAAGKRGDEYGVLKGLGDQFAIARRIGSMESKLEFILIDNNRRVEQLELNLSAEKRREFLETYVDVSTSRMLEDTYNSIFRSCGTELFDIFDKIMDYRIDQDVAKAFSKLSETNPAYARKALDVRGLLKGTEAEYRLPELAVDPLIVPVVADLRNRRGR